jgi:hypothetical protein
MRSPGGIAAGLGASPERRVPDADGAPCEPAVRRGHRPGRQKHRASAEAQRLNEQLSAALASRVVIEQAKGVVSERAGIDLAEAFTRLRAYARNHNLRLTDVAQAAIDGTLDPHA